MSYVYMIEEHVSDVKTRNYKIGLSATPAKRIVDLRAGNSRSLEFKHTSHVKSVQAAKDAEQEIHQKLDRYRIKDRAMAGTEWFYVEDNHFNNFEKTYLVIANKYKSERLNHFDEAGFYKYSLQEATRENANALKWVESLG